MIYTWYGTSSFVPFTALVAEARREAEEITGESDWKLHSVDEFNTEVEDDNGNVVDVEAKVVLRR